MGASLTELQWAAIQQLGAAKELKKHKREDALVVVGGGVIPPQDFEALVQLPAGDCDYGSCHRFARETRAGTRDWLSRVTRSSSHTHRAVASLRKVATA